MKIEYLRLRSGLVKRRGVPKRKGWPGLSTASTNDLPDSDFAYIEPGGHKDEEGKTVPRSLRHYPIKRRGKLDIRRIRNALARAAQALKRGGKTAEIARKALPAIEEAARQAGIGKPAEEAGTKPE